MRKDPPFDMEYFYATLCCSSAPRREGARVVNEPRALRDYNEKLAIARFPAVHAPTLVTRDMALIRSLLDEHRDMILKPLDGMGGTCSSACTASDPNRNVIIETITATGARTRHGAALHPARSPTATSASW